MLVAALDHISYPSWNFLLRICLTKEKSVDLYIIENSLKWREIEGENFVEDIQVKKITTTPYSIFLSCTPPLTDHMSKAK